MAMFQVGRSCLLALIVFCLTMTFGPSIAIAGPLATTNFAYDNGAGPDAGRWHGSALIAGAAFGDSVVAEVDWAVFSPGNFQSYLNSQSIAQLDPSGANELIYVYQISTVTTAAPGIETLTVGVDAPDPRGSVLAPAFVSTGSATEQSPTDGGDNTTSMAWFFSGTELHAGDTSSLLVFTSPNVPEYDFLSINSGLAGPANFPSVGSPSSLLFQIPEPTSLFLALIGCFGVMGVMGSRRRVAE
jgi:hypothetical protein